MFKHYTSYQWLLIDAANNFGLDKILFEERIKWAEDNFTTLEALTAQAKKKPLYIKAVMAIRSACSGIPTGHMVAVDGVCSGVQIMSAITGCIAGATATGLVLDNVRADAYTEVTVAINNHLGGMLSVSSADAKSAVMTSMYGSKAVPKEIFGEDTPELNAFYTAINQVAPGAWELLQELLGAWKPYALSHEWKLPDGFDAVVKVMSKKSVRIEVDELDHATFTYEFYENEGTKKGISLPANVVHSIDGYVLRSMHRRCNYDSDMVNRVYPLLVSELHYRGGSPVVTSPDMYQKVFYYVEQYVRSGIADVVILPYINEDTVKALSAKHIQELLRILDGMLQYKPFHLVTIHDSFASHPNHVNWVRWQYKEILADLADSELLSDLLSQIKGVQGKYTKKSTDLSKAIRQSNYALS